MVRTRSVVLPEPGLETRFRAHDPALGEVRSILGREPIVLAENILFHMNDTRLADTGHPHPRRARTIVEHAVFGDGARRANVVAMVAMRMIGMIMMVLVVMGMAVVLRELGGLVVCRLAASAYRTHYSTLQFPDPHFITAGHLELEGPT